MTSTKSQSPAQDPHDVIAAGGINAYAGDVMPADRELFETHLRDFIPPNVFDAHAHVYHGDLAGGGGPMMTFGRGTVGKADYDHFLTSWMGDLAPVGGLFFPFPNRDTDTAASNDYLVDEVKSDARSRGLMLVTGREDPADVEAYLDANPCMVGFKVYHCYAPIEQTFFAEIDTFLPEWVWELAHQRSLAIMLHQVKPTALADVSNQKYIREHCIQYPGAKLILAHCARSFCSHHNADGMAAIRGLDNVFFDSSSICEPTAMEEILRVFGPTRFFFATDHPISSLRGRCVSMGYGFTWTNEVDVNWSKSQFGKPTLVGIENLMALKRAAHTMSLNDRDLELIFGEAARQVLGIESASTQKRDVQKAYHAAKQIIPGGTQLLSKRPEMFAPEQWPAYYEEARGCELIDYEGRKFLDFSIGGILATVLGYADPDVNAAVMRRVQFGSMATLQTHDEVELAGLLTQIHPWASGVRYTRAGGEAVAVAVRIARARTKRQKVAICGYHGWHDWYLAANLSVSEGDDQLDGHLLPGLQPTGVPRALAGSAFTFKYNSLEQLDAVIAEHGKDLACIVMETTRHADPEPGFLEGVRERCDRIGARLIFDEISIGWRLCLGGAHLKFGVNPDIAVFAKTISNGFAMGAVIGNEDTMAAAQESFISSAYWTEGVGPAAGVATIKKLMRIDVPAHLRHIGQRVLDGWTKLGAEHKLPVKAGGRPEMTVLAFDHAKQPALLTLMTARMLAKGFLAAAPFNPMLAHEDRHVDAYLAALDGVFGEMALGLKKDDLETRIGGPVKHTGFARLVD